MAKLQDDPKVAALLERATAKAVREERARVSKILRELKSDTGDLTGGAKLQHTGLVKRVMDIIKPEA